MNAWAKRRAGFTIVELLIVVVVIAILAAITIVAYTGIQNRAKSSALQSTASQIARKASLYAAQNADSYPDLASFRAALSIPADTPTATYDYILSDDAKSYCLSITNTTLNPAVSFATSATSPGVVGGRCVKNLIPNPKIAAISGWTTTSAGSVGANSSQPTGGPITRAASYFQRATTAAATSSPINIVSSGTGLSGIPIEGSETYVMSLYARSSCVLGSGIRPDIVPYDTTGATQSTYNGGTNVNTASTWQRMSHTRTFASTSAYMRVQIAFSGPTTCPDSSTFDASGVMLTKGSLLYDYADGDSPGWAWASTPNNSASFGPAVTSN